MKKLTKIIGILVAAIICCMTLSLVACNSGKAAQNDYPLQLNVRYHSYDYRGDNENAWSYIFTSEKTGEFKRGTEYTIKFKYTWLDSEHTAVACFYDSAEKDGNPYEGNTSWCTVLTVSTNVLMTSGGALYISEKYLENELKNFGKKSN